VKPSASGKIVLAGAPVTLTIRPFEPRDTERLVAVVTTVFAEYRMRFDPTGFDRDLYDAGRRYAAPGAVFLTAEESGTILGFGGADTPQRGAAEIHRLYIDPRARGRGLGRLLVERLEEWAWARVPAMKLWSDVRLTHAHGLYAKLGYRLTGQRRLDDPDRSVEFGFGRERGGPRDDRPFVAKLSYVPVAALSEEETHAAHMVLAAILDSRTLPRLPDGGHALPALPGGEVVFQEPRILVGFREGERERLHPLFSARLPR
jgi:putative acetyltransferase